MVSKEKDINALIIKVEGLVQGIGFRPFTYRLAKKYDLNGYVRNMTDGVEIFIEGKKSAIEKYLSSLKTDAPVTAEIQKIITHDISPGNYSSFDIIDSEDLNSNITRVSPDIAVCENCLHDMKTQSHRLNYPLINCTHCGPRFTIVRDLPYDRPNTTMNEFEMCEKCRSEYENILDRRFHAQPIACNTCGPKYRLYYHDKIIEDLNEIVVTSAKFLKEGKIIAIKGAGGFHLMCDARNEITVDRLRKSKNREGKPFAVLFRDLNSVMHFAEVNDQEKEMLLSWKRPVVLLQMKSSLAPSVTLGLNTIGAFLPYMPVHYLFFEHLDISALVLTSGNISDEPIIIDNDSAIKTLGKISDAIITYNRTIHNRTDDSVVKVMSGKESIFRRSRGYVPSPVSLKLNAEGILATGAELSNCFCIGKDYQGILSQHIGDLKNADTYEFFTETIEKYKKLFRFTPRLVACDMHPDYLSSKYADELGIETIKVQHHHAHIAACMAEHNLDEPVIGISLDGTGFGNDGHTWGSEFLYAELGSFKRLVHFDYIELPGNDKVTEQPWRTAISFLFRIYGKELKNLNLPFVNRLNPEWLNMVMEALEKSVNCPLSSGAGRLFDAVAALLNVCTESTFHAEAPMRLESIVTGNTNERYEISFHDVIYFNEMIEQIVEDIQNNIDARIIATKFHNTIIYTIFKGAFKISKETGLKKVVFSGGLFQNKYIMEKTEPLLLKNGFQVYTHSKVPCNDGGLALGQLAVAAKMRE